MTACRGVYLSFILSTCAGCGFDGPVFTTTGKADASPSGPYGTASVVVAGQYSACALVEGKAYCWGDNTQGALGTGDLQNHSAPFAVATSETFDMIAVGASHACAIDHSEKALYCWGLNSGGQLGLGDGNPRLVPTRVTTAAPVQFVATGYSHTCAILTDGTLWCWGQNCEGQLGMGLAQTSEAINACTAGTSTALVVYTPAQVGSDDDWTFVAGGQGHSCGLRGTGALSCWGRSENGSLGLGDTSMLEYRSPQPTGSFTDWTFVELGQGDAYGVRSNGSLYGWGDLANSAVPPALVPTQIGTATDWVQTSTDTFSTCAVKKTGGLYCWGGNMNGELGLANLDMTYPTPVQTGLSNTWQNVTVGRFFTCAQSTDGGVFCAGSNTDGELGVGNTTDTNVFAAVTLPSP